MCVLQSVTANQNASAVAEQETHAVAGRDTLPDVVKTSQCTKKPQNKKPARPCPFCHKMLPRLQRHMRSVHKDEPAVKKACSLSAKDRNAEFKSMRRQGIWNYNRKQMQSKSPKKLKRERRRNDTLPVMCSSCNAFFSRRFFSRHKSNCNSESESVTAVPVPLLRSAGDKVSVSSVTMFCQNSRRMK